MKTEKKKKNKGGGRGGGDSDCLKELREIITWIPDIAILRKFNAIPSDPVMILKL